MYYHHLAAFGNHEPKDTTISLLGYIQLAKPICTIMTNPPKVSLKRLDNQLNAVRLEVR
jgi:hypothetical protein